MANEYTKCGEGVCPEIAKTSAIGVSLACLIGNRMILRSIGLSREFFRAESDSKFNSALPKCIVDALFQVKSEE